MMHRPAPRRWAEAPGGVGVARRGTLVTVGTSTKYPFPRLLRAVIDTLPLLPSPVTIQHAGAIGPFPSGVDAVDMLSRPDFMRRLSRSRLVIAHAGAGTLLEAMRIGVPVIAMPRRPEFGEVADGHQLEFAVALRGSGCVHFAGGADDIRAALASLDLSTTCVGHTLDLMNRHLLVQRVRALIDAALVNGARPRIALVATSGGHMTELRQLADAYRLYPHFYIESKWQASGSNNATTYVYPSVDRDWRVARHVGSIARTLSRERPGIVLTTGSGSALPVLLIARAMRSRLIYIESVTRVTRPSLAARLASPICDTMLVRWPALLRSLPAAELIPALGREG